MKKNRFKEGQIIAVLKEHVAGIGIAELCRKHGISDATFYTWRKRYGGMEVSDAKRLKALAKERCRFGYRRLQILLRPEGIEVSHKKLFRLYREERLTVCRRGGRRRAMGTRAPLTLSQGPSQRWSVDVVSDQLSDGRRFSVLVVDTSLSGARVARELDRLIAQRRKPLMVVSDYGTKYEQNPSMTGDTSGATSPHT